ncbi:protein GAST1 isoform X2 [Humulus lupulus]|uniref:protein GAST1 isoform X2 n=1 Tax=Humulus lupulus TaxID=3486 RepID=UPI002B40115A|nr:protein GAST1 isoform X2 [Humulus lupulus]
MARELSLVMFSFLLLLLVTDTHATKISEAPSPQPQFNTTTGKPYMHGITEGSLKPEECHPRCTARCSNTQYRKPCMFFCQKCCATCLCVPPGTYGNKQVCPRYNNWKTKRGGPKCP